MVRARLAALALLGLAALAPPASAGFLVEVTPTVDPVGGGFQYRYVVANPAENAGDGDPDLIFDFLLSVATDAALTDLVTPEGWTATYAPGAPEIDWMATDLPFAIAPGASLTFGFTSPLGPDAAPFTALALNQLSGGGNVDQSTGTTIGPAGAVPEPSSLLMMGTGALVLLGYVWRRRRPAPVASM